jgi:hypothetical protein
MASVCDKHDVTSAAATTIVPSATRDSPEALATQWIRAAASHRRFLISETPHAAIAILAACVTGDLANVTSIARAVHQELEGQVGILGLLLLVAAKHSCRKEVQVLIDGVLYAWMRDPMNPFEHMEMYSEDTE